MLKLSRKDYFYIQRLLCCLLLLSGTNSSAYNYSGRISLGVVAITERYKTDEYGSNANDFLIASNRFYNKLSEMGESKWEFVSDIRNKYDQFGHLNQDNLNLDSKNQFQIRELSLRNSKDMNGFLTEVGRFNISESGSVFNDGALLGYQLSEDWKTGLFGGFNPRSTDYYSLDYNAHAQQNGAFLTYKSSRRSWDLNHYLSHGFVHQTYYGQTERDFFYHNWNYQWSENSRFLSTVFYDFKPISRLQFGHAFYQQEISKNLNTELSTLFIDSAEYARRQELLEKLTPTSYQENQIKFMNSPLSENTYAIKYSSGHRKIDQLVKQEIELGYANKGLISRNYEFQIKAGYSENFTSKDTFTKVSLGYFSKLWELTLDTEYMVRKNDTTNTITHPVFADAGFTRLFSRQLYITSSLQYAADEYVKIFSTFLKLGYRFGNQETHQSETVHLHEVLYEPVFVTF